MDLISAQALCQAQGSQKQTSYKPYSAQYPFDSFDSANGLRRHAATEDYVSEESHMAQEPRMSTNHGVNQSRAVLRYEQKTLLPHETFTHARFDARNVAYLDEQTICPELIHGGSFSAASLNNQVGYGGSPAHSDYIWTNTAADHIKAYPFRNADVPPSRVSQVQDNNLIPVMLGSGYTWPRNAIPVEFGEMACNVATSKSQTGSHDVLSGSMPGHQVFPTSPHEFSKSCTTTDSAGGNGLDYTAHHMLTLSRSTDMLASDTKFEQDRPMDDSSSKLTSTISLPMSGQVMWSSEAIHAHGPTVDPRLSVLDGTTMLLSSYGPPHISFDGNPQSLWTTGLDDLSTDQKPSMSSSEYLNQLDASHRSADPSLQRFGMVHNSSMIAPIPPYELSFGSMASQFSHITPTSSFSSSSDAPHAGSEVISPGDTQYSADTSPEPSDFGPLLEKQHWDQRADQLSYQQQHVYAQQSLNGLPMAPTLPSSYYSLSSPDSVSPSVSGVRPDRTRMTTEQKKHQDFLLKDGKARGMSYKQMKSEYGWSDPEPTLRGRYRNLIKRPEERVRRPVWTSNDIELLIRAVFELAKPIGPGGVTKASYVGAGKLGSGRFKIAWKDVAARIRENGGSYVFGNSTCKKKWVELRASGRADMRSVE
ncbi:hypothetical protein LTR66_006311 [Elasticomyces elasticus]|nr:hypothetical protein LTR66_006311 [Elasticomyces elasticus]